MNHKLRLKYRHKRFMSKALALVLSAALFAGGLVSYDTTVYAETPEVVFDAADVSGSDVSANEVVATDVSASDVSESDAPAADVSANDVSVSDVPAADVSGSEASVTDVSANETPVVLNSSVNALGLTETGLTYKDFISDTTIATLNFGTDITAEDVFTEDAGFGFSDTEYNTEAAGTIGGIYYPRVPSKDHVSGASYVTNGDGYLTIASKAWTETETTYNSGVYTYENTSSFDMVLDPADYKVEVTFVNPTSSAYTAYLEAEEITKKSGIAVAAGATVTESYIACLVDGTLNLKFLAASSATTIDAAATQNVCVSQVKVTRLATEMEGLKPTIFIASDSTVQTYDAGVYPQTGWGQTLALFFDEDGVLLDERECEDCGFSQSQTYEADYVIVENRAIGGRSSKSYIDEGKLDDLLEDVKPGDYLFVQWGHNDSTYARPNRYVSPADFEKWIQYYVDGALQRGATPVLVTPVARYSYVTNDDGTATFVGNFENYGNVMREMAAEQGIALVDLTQRSVALCNDFGVEGSKSLFMILAPGEYDNYPSGQNDQTHIQYYGAYKFAQCVAKGIQESSNANLASLKEKVRIYIPASVPAKVANLKTGAIGATSVAMSWDADADAELYYIYRQALTEGQTIDDVDFSNAEKFSVSSTAKYTDAACEAGVTYVYAVRGFNEKGLGELSDKISATTKSAGWKFDINAAADGPTEEGWTGVYNEMYADNKANGWGWITYPGAGRDRGVQDNDAYSLMGRDFSLGEGEFALDIPNGDYEVTVYGGDILPGTSTQKTTYQAEGTAIGTMSARQTVSSVTNTIRVEDGQLNIKIVSAGALNYFNGFTVTELLKAPSGLSYLPDELKIDTDTGAAAWTISFNTVDEAVSYKIYVKNSTDTEYSVFKTFTAAEYAENDLNGRSMSGEAGETYSIYMTCVTADGTESAASNKIEIKTVMEGDQAAAPANVVCTSPAEGATELQKTISLKWDAVDGAFKYVIYRSTKLEDEKGYKGFEKVGESKTTEFTDTNDVATNISYYYKVAAMTVTGLGKMSEICKTPVTGKMVAGARETYADRAVVAINLAGADGGEDVVTATDKDGNEYASGVYLSWRSFEKDLDSNNNVTTTFTVYRDGAEIASNLKVTNLIDPAGTASSVYKVVGSNDGAIGVTAKDTAVWANKYLELSLYCPDDATMPDGSTCTYEANDMSVGDLNGDGDLELIVKWYPSNAKDNSGSGYTGKTYLDGYDVDFATGKVSLLWRIDMGVNIRSGAHYTQFQVWDFDCDGKAEIAVKTADGTTAYKSADGTLAGLEMVGYVGKCSAADLPESTISEQNDYRNTSGYIIDGPEYFSIFNGEDATKAAEDVSYLPARGNVAAWGDSWGNRVDRFLSATAYLNGETPFAVFCRGYYTRTCLTAYYMKDTDGDSVGDAIDVYWEFDTNVDGTQYEAQGNHGLSINDVDNDGKDEIIYGALVIDHNGEVMYSTNLGHGDAMHVSDWVSWNDGLEIMAVHEHDNAAYHVEIHDAETGKVIMGYYTGKDTGRGVAADIDPTAEGGEWWSIASPTYESNDEPAWDSTNGEVYSTWSTMNEDGTPNLIKLANSTPASNASIFWDGDLLSEVQDHTFNKEAYAPTGVRIYKWNYEKEQQDILFGSTEVWSTNGTKGNLGLIGDILGDWREEIVTRTSADKNVIRVYSTTIETDYVVPCLLENLAYREGIAWQNVGYNQPANLTYMLSEGLVTAELSEGEDTTATTAEILFTPANDGDLFGHDITAYKVFRAAVKDGVVGEYEEVATIPVDQLDKEQIGGGSDSGDDVVVPDPDPVWLRFDFGATATQSGWIAVDAADAFSTEKGYGFTDVSTNANKSYAGAIDGDYANVYNDAVLAWTTAATGFDVVVPNGTYDVTYYIYNGSGHVYNQVTAEGVAYADVRRGATDKQATCQTVQVEVTDGVLNIVNTGSKNNYNGLYFTGIEIKDVTYDAWYEAWLEKIKPIKYQFDFGAVATQEGWTAVDAADAFSAEKGYGFTDVSTNANKSYAGAITGDNADVYNDAVLAWTTAATGFDVVVPNGKYAVTYYIYNGSGHVYNQVTAEGVAYADVRRGATDKQATCQTVEVEVTDGVLNIVNTGSKNNYNGLYFTGIEIVPEGYDAAYAEWYALYCDWYGIVPDIAPTWLKFDFGAVATQEGWTAVDAADVFSTAKGYGFTDVSTNANKSYDGAITGDNADVYNDAVLAWTTAATGFDVVVPNGTYEVTYYIYNGSGHVYNQVTAEGVAYADVRRGATDKQATFQTVQVEVTDGVLNIVNTGSKNNYNGLYFTGIEIKDVTYDDWYEAWLEKNKPVKYQFDFGAVATQEGWTAVDAADAFSTEKGYGFTDVSTNANKSYAGAITGDNADVYNDAVLAWTTAATGFDVVVPNGKYNVTYYIYNGSGHVYNQVTAEGVSYADVRRGATDKQATCETVQVEVADGVLNIVNTGSKTNYNGLYFTGIEIVPENYDTAYAEWYALYTAYYGTTEGDSSEAEGDATTEATAVAAIQAISLLSQNAVAAVSEDTESDAEWVYSYTDTGLTGNTEYSYKIAAVVDDKTSHMSRPLVIKTAVDIVEIVDAELADVVEDTPIAEGETVASLLRPTVVVKDASGAEVECDVTWDVSAVDITTPGEYTVIGSFKGSDMTVTKTLKVVANALKGVETLANIETIIGSQPVLPEKVKVEYTNTTSEEVAVTWDTSSIDVNTLGEYKINGAIAGYDNMVAEVTVVVIPNFIASVADTYVDVELGADKEEALPYTVVATWGNGDLTNEAVTWNADDLDTSVLGTSAYTGVIEGFDKEVTLNVRVVYPALYKFDFGVVGSPVADGWIGIVGNGKGGTKTAEELDIHYTAERGYGFEDPSVVFEGRPYGYTYAGYLPSDVYNDCLMPSSVFVVDVENGKYEVEFSSACGDTKGNSTVNAKVEGESISVRTAAPSYTLGSITVEVADGQLTIDYTGVSLARTGSIVVRQVVEEETETPDAGGSGDSSSDSSDDSSDDNDDSISDIVASVENATLEEAVTIAGALSQNQSKYTAASWASFQTAYNAAMAVLNNAASTPEQIAAAKTALANAIAALKLTASSPKTGQKRIVVDEATDWNDVIATIEKMQAEADGKITVYVELGKYNTIDAEALEAILGKDVVLNMEQEIHVVWEVNGCDIAEANAVDLEVLLGSENVPMDALVALAGENDCMTMSLKAMDDFGFKTTLKVPFEAKDNGMYANLYKYNENGAFEYVTAVEIGEGYASFVMTGAAAEYVIVLSETPMAETLLADNAPLTTLPGADIIQTPTETIGEESVSNLPLFAVIIAVIIAGGAAIAMMVRRKKEEE